MSTRMQFAWYALSLTGRGSLFGPPGLAYALDLQPETDYSLSCSQRQNHRKCGSCAEIISGAKAARGDVCRQTGNTFVLASCVTKKTQ